MQSDRADGPLDVSTEERHAMIAVAAYYLAEQRGFPGSGALDDWINAERHIDHMIERMRNNGATRRTLERVGLRNALHLWGQDGD
jgi:hypothetical protein